MKSLKIFLLIIFTTPLSNASQFHSFLSVVCSQTSLNNNRTIKLNLKPNPLTKIMQCLPNLKPDLCTLCAKNAQQTIQKFCPNSSSVTAWFDGCYIQHYSHKQNANEITNCSCSNRTIDQNQVGNFELNLAALLLRLRADIYVTTHHTFSKGHVENSNGSRIYGLVKCVEPLSAEECEDCIVKAMDRIYKHCGGKEGGTVANDQCIVRYETYQFFSELNSSSINGGINERSNGVAGAVKEWGREKGSDSDKYKVKEVLLIWGIGLICFGVIVFCYWLLKRSIVNKARVAAFSDISRES